MTSETDTVLGQCLSITDQKGNRHCYLTALEEVTSSAHDPAIIATEEVLSDYGCRTSLEKGYITLNSDYGLHAAAVRMTWNNAVDPNHTIDRLLKRALEELPQIYSITISEQFEKTTKFARDAKHCISKKQLRREPPELFPSLNCFLKSKSLTPIPTWTEVRFRSLADVVDTISKAKDTLLELEMSENDPNERFLQSMPSFRFISPLQDMLQNAFMPLINFSDSQQCQQNGELVPMYESILNWACIASDTNNYSIELKKCVVAAVMEQITGGQFVFDNQVQNSLVKNRLTPNELVSLYGCPPRKTCRLEKIRYILRKGGFKKEAELILNYVEEENLKQSAIDQIKQFDSILNPRQRTVVNQSPIHSGTESSELSDEEPQSRSRRRRRVPEPVTTIEDELKQYEDDSGEGSYENFKAFAKERQWSFRKSSQGLILQNENLMAYWKSKIAHFPRLAKVMLFVLRTPCSSSPLERFFSSITLQTSSHASNRTTEYVEQINQISPKNDDFFTVMNELYAKFQ